MRRSLSWTIMLAFAAGWGGCVDVVGLPFALDAEVGDLVIVAVTDADGSAREAGHYRFGQTTLRLPLESDDAVYAFVVAKDALVDATGVAIGEEMIEGLRIVITEEFTGCPSLAFDPPQVVHANDRCPAPPFARGHGTDEARVDSVREQLRLEWPGESSCRPPSPTTRPLGTLELGLPDPGFVPYGVAAGAAPALFGEHAAVRFREGTPSVVEVPFVGPVLAAHATSSGHFLVSTRDATAVPLQSTVTVFDSDLTVVRGPQGDMHRTTRFVQWDETHLLRLGEGPLRLPKALACSGDTTLACAPLNVDGLDWIGREVRDAIRLSDDRMLLVLPHGLVALDRFVDPTTFVSIERLVSTQPILESGVIRTTTGTVAWKAVTKRIDGFLPEETAAIELQDAAPLDDGRFLVCANGGGRSLILVGRFDVPLTVVSSARTQCGGLVAEAKGIRILSTDGTSVIVDRSGAVVVPAMPFAPEGIEGQIVELSVAGSQTLARGGDDRLWVETATDSYALMYGPVAPTLGGVVEIASVAEGWAAVHASGALTRDLGQGPITTRFDGPSLEIHAAAYDAERRAFFVAGRGWSGWLGIDDGALAGRQTIPAEGVRGVALVDEARALVATREGTLLLVADQESEVIDVDWDDPTTEVIEVRPPRDRQCDFGSGTNDDVFRDVAVTEGLAWAVGCGGVLLAINVFADPPVARRRATDFDTVAMQSISAACPSDVLIGGADPTQTRGPREWVWQLTSLGLEDAEIFTQPPTTDFSYLGALRGVARQDGAIYVRHERGIRALGKDGRFSLEDTPTAIGAGVMGTATGRFYFERR